MSERQRATVSEAPGPPPQDGGAGGPVSGSRGSISRRRLAGALVLAAGGLCASASAAPPALDPLLERIDAASAGVSTLAGQFTQRNKVALFKQELRSSGRFYFRKPRQIRWEYTAPDPSTMVLDGNRATLSTPGEAPRSFDLDQDPTLRAVFDQLLLWLGSGSLAHARADYDLAAAGTGEQPALTLRPKEASALARTFQRIELRLDGKTYLPRSILLVEKSGDEKEISFTKLERNAALPERAFAL
jgi:outer membrane lipoprotein carrier protein